MVIRREIGFFILNGIISVIIAYVIYQTLVSVWVLEIHWASGIAYVFGTSYGFFSNRRWAFQDRRLIMGKTIILFVTLYFFTLMVNVSVNVIMLELIDGLRNDILLPFITAISISTILNFIGLKYFVFRQKRDITLV